MARGEASRTGRCTITTCASRCASTVRSSPRAFSNLPCRAWTWRRRWRAPWGWRRLPPRTDACWARRSGNDAAIDDDAVRHRFAQSGAGGERHFRLRGGVRKAGGSQRAGRLRGEGRSEEHTSELQSLRHLVCRLLLEKKKRKNEHTRTSADTTTHMSLPHDGPNP